MTRLFDEVSGRYPQIPDPLTEDAESARREMADEAKEDLILDMSTAIYENDYDMICALHDAWSGFSMPDQWGTEVDGEVVNLIRAVDRNDVEKIIENATGIRDAATKAAIVEAQKRIK